MSGRFRTPSATYRLQFSSRFRLRDARRLVPYLDALGVTDLYASPFLRARSGSPHGYDVTDPTRIDPQRGTERDLASLARALRRREMGLLLDIVPNHMAASPENPWWRDVLEHGPSSPFTGFFDIDWAAGGGKVVLPILGAPVREVLRRGKLEVERRGGRPGLRYFDIRLPLRPVPGEPLPRSGPGREAEWRRLLERQFYRLEHGRAGARRLNYRRFFDIDRLVGVRVEDPRVFGAIHARVLEWARRGRATGLRIDHIDGLLNPEAYLRRLRRSLPRGTRVVVEKVLSGDEPLPEPWPAEGTTGYDFLGALNALLVKPEGLEALGRLGRRITGSRKRPGQVVLDAKRQVLREMFPAEFRRLAGDLAQLAARDSRACSISRGEWARALEEVTVRLPVYRTYLRGGRVPARDRAFVEAALRGSSLSPRVRSFLRRILLSPRETAQLRFVLKWQQFTGPVTAKGAEDTASYRHLRLISLNEVGGEMDPRAPGEVEAFHRWNRARGVRWPGTLNATSTHDTKRSEDVRARLHVLSEVPDDWAERVARWRRWNRVHARPVGGKRAPEPGEEYFLYQTLAGAWPLRPEEVPEFRERLRGYLVKAAREAKVCTSWLQPDGGHERALLRFADRILEPSRSNRFLPDFLEFQEQVAWCGALNSLSQVVLKVASPGVPDFYQGGELWDFSLVDPDNRRPVDFRTRAARLRELEHRLDGDRSALLRDLWTNWRDGAIKLFTTRTALRFRGSHRALFAEGAYLPLRAEGPRAAHVVAFARVRGRRWTVAATGRWFAGLGEPGTPASGSGLGPHGPRPAPGGAAEVEGRVHRGEHRCAGRAAVRGGGFPGDARRLDGGTLNPG